MKEKKVVGYIRVSSQEQKDAGDGLKAQRQKILQWADLHDYKVLEIFADEGVSGTKTDRPGLTKALNLACKEKAVFVVYSLSRFSRSTTDTLKFTSRLQKAGAELVSISEQIDTLSAAGKMVFRVLAVLNEFESDVAGERTKAALDYRRSKGLKTGGRIPFGFDVDKNLKLILNDAEQNVIRKISIMRRKGKRYAEIARTLNEKGIKTKYGKQWQIQTVKNVLKKMEHAS